MEKTKYTTLPIIGQVQHGEKIETDGKVKVKQYDYFIAKIRDNNMKGYLEKFNSYIRGSNSIDIQFLDDNPLSIRMERNNQKGCVCYCLENSNLAKQKEKNLWKQIECNSSCEHLVKDQNGKSACNRVAWLKFFIPSIATDRLWLMKITGQQSINNLQSYLEIQKQQGNSLKEIFALYLTEKEQTNMFGKTFNNYVLDISKKENFIQSQYSKSKEEQYNINSNDNEKNLNSDNKQFKDKTKSKSKKNSAKISENSVSSTKEQQTAIKENIENSSKVETKETTNIYTLLGTCQKEISLKSGGTKEYTFAQFVDNKDVILEVALKQSDAEEIQKCELGTVVKIKSKDIQEIEENKFALKIEFMTKFLKVA